MLLFVFIQSILPREEGFNGLTGGIVAHQQPTLPSLSVGYKQNAYGTTLPKIPVATTNHTTTFPTSFHSIIHQEKNKVKVCVSVTGSFYLVIFVFSLRIFDVNI